MGWLGWTPEQAFNASIPDILTAYEGRMDMLKAIFGGSEDGGAKGAPSVNGRPMSPQLFDAVFGR